MSTDESVEKIPLFYVDEPPITSNIESFFLNYASIPASELRDHLIINRKRAWQNCNYPCLGRWSFLDFSIQHSPIYKEILENCKNEGATVIDFACCLGQDLRQLIYDGVSLDQIRGYELDLFFIDQGYELFRDGELMKKKKILNCNDIFDDEFLEKVEPADYLYAGLFIHLFDAKTQRDVCRRLTRLCKRAITGRHVGSLVSGERLRYTESMGGKIMCHSPESFACMWNEVTDGEWQVESATFPIMDDVTDARQMLTFVVRKKANNKQSVDLCDKNVD